jgi:hypothetical protein
MDVIAGIAATVLAFFASVLGSILAYDICVSADRTCAKIIRNASSRLAPRNRESGEMEWLADLHERDTVYEKYRHATGCFLVAGKMRRQAQTVMVAMSFNITGVGTVPVTLRLNSKVVGPLFLKALQSRPSWARKAAIIFAALYLLMKFFMSANASLPSGFKITREHLKRYKSWGYDAHIRGNGFDMPLGGIFRLMVLQPERIQEMIKKVGECLAPLKNLRSAATDTIENRPDARS